ncbi:hypothetical protein NGM37_07335, partial [Streptomyces sp. TRM76130]|nr:hypothetical protein [Streptomyces sp. TRM76130]
NTPSNRPSRLRTASYLLSSSPFTPSSLRHPAGLGLAGIGHRVRRSYPWRPRLASMAARPSAPRRFHS